MIKLVDLRAIKPQYLKDPVFNIYSKEKDNLDKSDLIRMTLASGFHFNAAKRLPNSKEDYILMHEGNTVILDPSSSYSKKEKYPNYLIFTELGGNSMGLNLFNLARGFMRLVSEVERSWVEGYMDMSKELDLFRLAGMEIDTAKIEEERKELLKELQVNEKTKREDKLSEAKHRYAQRKKVKLN